MNAKPDPPSSDPDVARLSDAELASYIHHWSQARARYQEQATDQLHRGRRPPGSKDAVNASTARPGFSAWWAGKILDRGLRERERRRQSQTTNDSGSRHD